MKKFYLLLCLIPTFMNCGEDDNKIQPTKLASNRDFLSKHNLLWPHLFDQYHIFPGTPNHMTCADLIDDLRKVSKGKLDFVSYPNNNEMNNCLAAIIIADMNAETTGSENQSPLYPANIKEIKEGKYITFEKK